jgi:hypothetical protein
LATAGEDNDGRGAQPTHGKATTPVPKPKPQPNGDTSSENPWQRIRAGWEEDHVDSEEQRRRTNEWAKANGIPWDKVKKGYSWTVGAVLNFEKAQNALRNHTDPLADDGPIDHKACCIARWDEFKITPEEREYKQSQHQTDAGIDWKTLNQEEELRLRNLDDAHNADETPIGQLFNGEGAEAE